MANDSQQDAGRKHRKPKLIIKHGQEARAMQEQEDDRPLTVWGIIIRFLPIWVLLIMIIILAPSLPFQIIGASVQWLRELGPEPNSPQSADPVFIVEGAGVRPEEGDIPTPGWELEIATFYTDEVQYWKEDILEWSLTYRVEPNMIATLIQIESCGDPTVESPVGAMGLFQVMPFHFENSEDPFDPDTNAMRGLTFFAEMLASANNDVGLAFAAYNGGQGVIGLSPADWPEETQYYQFWGSGIYEEAAAGLSDSPTLTEWLGRGGGSALCTRAANTLGISNN